MPPLEIHGTELRHLDELGGAVVRLRTSNGTYENEMRVWTQSDAYATFGGAVAQPSVPTPVVANIVDLTSRRVGTIRTAPGAAARAVDYAGRLVQSISLRSDALSILAGVPRGRNPWLPQDDRAWLRMAAATRAQVVALPAPPRETPAQLARRLERAATVMESLPDHVQKHVIATVRLDNRQFIPCVERVIEEGRAILAIEFHGLTHGIANLDSLRDTLRIARHPPYVVGTNVPRTVRGLQASGCLISSWGGVQASAPAVPHGYNPPAGEQSEQQRMQAIPWFVQNLGGFVPMGTLPAGWDLSDTCPDAGGHFTPDLAGAFDVRRRHDTWGHVADKQAFAQAVAAGDFRGGYQAPRPLLNAALQQLS